MSSQDEIGKNFLDRLTAESEANRTKNIQKAERQEAAFSSIKDGVEKLSKEVEKLGNPQWSIKIRGVEDELDGGILMVVSFNKNGKTEVVHITLKQKPNGLSEFVIEGLPDRAQRLISGARADKFGTGVHADANQGFEIAKALEEFAVMYFAKGY